jgi:hypothetical protein
VVMFDFAKDYLLSYVRAPRPHGESS